MKTTIAMMAMALISGLAMAQDDAQDKSFGELDVNRDLQISADEARADSDVAAQFAELDANEDGYLDANEFARLDRRDQSYQ